MSFLFRRKKQEPKSRLDALTIAALRQHGVDLTRARDVRHYLYFPSEDEARRAAAELKDDGLSLEVRPPAQGTDWLVLANHSIVVDEVAISALRARFERVTASLHGQYDGWEAAAD